MASFEKVKTGWRAAIAVKGKRESATFSTKAEAQAWAGERETTLRKHISTGVSTDKTCDDAFKRYSEEVSTTKKGIKWELTKLTALANHPIDNKPFGSFILSEVNAETIAKWRDGRLKTVAGSTVNRELNLLAHVFTIARKEWKWITTSPTADVARPKDPSHRDRRIGENEIERLCFALGFDGKVTHKSSAVAVAFLFAIETAMRAGEICWLNWKYIKGTVATLPPEITKRRKTRGDEGGFSDQWSGY